MVGETFFPTIKQPTNNTEAN